MNLIFTKNVELQDAKYRLVSNNNNETSIFIPKYNGEAIGLVHDEEFTFYLNKENVLYTLFNTYNYSLDHTIFEKIESVKIDYNKVFDLVDLLRLLPDLFSYTVKVSVNGNRFYLKELRQENRFNLRDILIGGVYQLNFYKNLERQIVCRVILKAVKEINNIKYINNQFNESSIDLISEFANWLNKNPKSNYFDNDYNRTIKGLEKINEKYKDSFGEDLFVINKFEIFSIVDQINKNIWNKESSFWLYSEASSTHLPRAILNDNNYQRFLREYYFRNEIRAVNKIFFGPPGTGKSHAIKEELKKLGAKANNYSRVTFHPDYDYHSFLGGYKPFTDKEDEDKIKYKFVPQVFTDLYVKAWTNTNEDYYLVIEEINRGNCAEIFGDVFQLLDRNPEYNIEPSSELKSYLKEVQDKINENLIEEDQIKLLFDGKLQMPPNLSIFASMNTSDQSLYPMDSAFKRRWDWQYVPIDLKCTKSNFTIKIDDTHQYSWLEFIVKVNDKIYSVTKSEDKQIGNWFINGSKSDNIISKDLFINKVLFYLWNDIFKDEVFHPENIFIEKNNDGTKLRDISFNNFYNKDEHDRLLIHLINDILNVPQLTIIDEIVNEYVQENEASLEAADTNQEYIANTPESRET